MEIKFTFKEAEDVGNNLFLDYKVFAPVKKVNKGRFSDTDLITYDYVNSLNEIEFFNKTHYSVKEILLPVRQTLFSFNKDKMIEKEENIPPTIIFLRSCDIYAMQITDIHFLKGDFEDNYYKKRRQSLKIFLIECMESFDGCFCVSMGTNRTEDYSVFMRKTKEGFEAKIKDSYLEKYFSRRDKIDVEPRFPEKDRHPIVLPEAIDKPIFKDEMWQEYTKRCIACGRCTVSCPTCTCFTIQDILKEGRAERRRIWSSCQVKKFSTLAGGHDFRIPYGDRMRYKVLHKINDFKKRYGINMCVGCGRCEDVCPEYISMRKCIERINSISGEENKND